MPQRYSYGDDPSQYADLFLPAEQRHRAVVVIIHGGYWRSQYDAGLGVPLAEDLSARGYACWNLEYRRAGNGGGWPETFDDVGSGIDALVRAAVEHELELENVIALGHSAGGHLAVWAAGRDTMPDGGRNGPSDPTGSESDGSRVKLTGVVSQSGLLNLHMAHSLGLSGGAAENLMGAAPETDPERWRLADPMSAIPLNVPVFALHGEDDVTVPLSESTSYVDAAVAAGADVELRMIPGDHFGMITADTAAWEQVVTAVADLAQETDPAPG
ncbi:alpha/beta hydrolase family protein [Arthrobacter roseus]|uniref:alpha/beta hydrolase family protein n=1 Tax=Arthrobacter roseus TaxID=136274 RepID=UPI0019666667|nr:alpha/beta hydrolase [Arthrobacter roseus]MBM7847250.1 acetyl esterase/lipase [Arthrobacter roseus]